MAPPRSAMCMPCTRKSDDPPALFSPRLDCRVLRSSPARRVARLPALITSTRAAGKPAARLLSRALRSATGVRRIRRPGATPIPVDLAQAAYATVPGSRARRPTTSRPTMKMRTMTWRARPTASWKVALKTGVADRDPYDEGEQAGDHQEHAEPARDKAAHDSRSAHEKEGHAEQDPEIYLEAPLGPANGFGIGEAGRLFGPRRGGPSVYCLLERDAIHRLLQALRGAVARARARVNWAGDNRTVAVRSLAPSTRRVTSGPPLTSPEFVLILVAFAGLLVLCRALRPETPYLALLSRWCAHRDSRDLGRACRGACGHPHRAARGGRGRAAALGARGRPGRDRRRPRGGRRSRGPGRGQPLRGGPAAAANTRASSANRVAAAPTARSTTAKRGR